MKRSSVELKIALQYIQIFYIIDLHGRLSVVVLVLCRLACVPECFGNEKQHAIAHSNLAPRRRLSIFFKLLIIVLVPIGLVS